MILTKRELDKAAKDKNHKVFPEQFKVEIVLEPMSAANAPKSKEGDEKKPKPRITEAMLAGVLNANAGNLAAIEAAKTTKHPCLVVEDILKALFDLAALHAPNGILTSQEKLAAIAKSDKWKAWVDSTALLGSVRFSLSFLFFPCVRVLIEVDAFPLLFLVSDFPRRPVQPRGTARLLDQHSQLVDAARVLRWRRAPWHGTGHFQTGQGSQVSDWRANLLAARHLVFGPLVEGHSA